MPAEHVDKPPRPGVPNARSAVGPGGDEGPAIGGVFDVVHLAAVVADPAPARPANGVPEVRPLETTEVLLTVRGAMTIEDLLGDRGHPEGDQRGRPADVGTVPSLPDQQVTAANHLL